MFKSNNNLTLNSDRLRAEYPTIGHIQIIDKKTKLIMKSYINEIDIQGPKERTIISLTST